MNFLIILLILSVVSVLIIAYGIVSSKEVKVNHRNTDIGLKIAHISDTHFDERYTSKQYQTVIDVINEAEPDVLFFTGDLFQVKTISDTLEEEITTFLSNLKCDHKYAVLGNHDYYGEGDFTDQVIDILESSGFVVLVNQVTELTLNDSTYQIVGLDDYKEGNREYNVVLDTLDEEKQTIILSHQPDTFDLVMEYDFLAMFSGHSHGGQLRLPIIGDIYNVPGAKKYNEKHYLVDGKNLYISFGLGESVVNFRLFNPRQFEIYDNS